eukprot:scaffold651720_cov52-Prasinocladus_malaysianus.AAC.1
MYAEDQNKFFEDFSQAFIKLTVRQTTSKCFRVVRLSKRTISGSQQLVQNAGAEWAPVTAAYL